MIGVAETESLGFRAPREFAEETRRLAGEQPLSQYLRDAVREKNERELAERMRMLSARLSAKNLAENKSMEGALGDGLA